MICECVCAVYLSVHTNGNWWTAIVVAVDIYAAFGMTGHTNTDEGDRRWISSKSTTNIYGLSLFLRESRYILLLALQYTSTMSLVRDLCRYECNLAKYYRSQISVVNNNWKLSQRDKHELKHSK